MLCYTIFIQVLANTNMKTEAQQLHVLFLPFMAQGHMIPTIDMAKLFASRGAKATIVTTSHFATFLSKTIENSEVFSSQIQVLTIRFPCTEVGLPEGIESFHMATSLEMHLQFFKATTILGPQIEQLLIRHRPDCLVADLFFPWATDVAAKYGIPRLVFHETGCFSSCCLLSLFLYEPQKMVSSNSAPFVIPNLTEDVEFTREKLPHYMKEDVDSDFSKMYKAMKESELRSHGVIVNSFYEMEPAYADHYRNGLGVNKAWQIGPLFLYNKRDELEVSINEKQECLVKWLDSKKPNSVIYVCFGSMVNFSYVQMKEIATGLEASGKQFIWVVKEKQEGVVREEWLPLGYEERIEGKGLIVRGWAPQMMILEHEAIGGFVTHCGWNSTLEGVCSGKPMVTWPVSAEQFYNEKLVSQVLRIGIEVGAKKWTKFLGDDGVKSEDVEKAVREIMEGEEAEEMRSRAKRLAEMAKSAVEEGGSSRLDLSALFEDLRLWRAVGDST